MINVKMQTFKIGSNRESAFELFYDLLCIPISLSESKIFYMYSDVPYVCDNFENTIEFNAFR